MDGGRALRRLWQHLLSYAGLEHVSIRTKVLLSPLAAVALLGTLLSIHAQSLDRQRALANEGVRRMNPVMTQALVLPQHLQRVRFELRQHALRPATEGGVEGPAPADGEAETALAGALAQLSRQVDMLEQEGLAEPVRLREGFDAYARSIELALGALEDGAETGAAAVARSEEAFEGLARRADAVVTRARRMVEALEAREDETARQITRISLSTMLSAGAAVVLIGLVSSRSIAHPLDRLLASIRRLRRGDLDREIPMTERRDEFGEAARAVARFREVLIERRALEDERERQREALDHMAHHDTLTGLPNRPLTERFLEQAFSDRRGGRMPLALLVLDLDAFKPINDSLGHAAGDAVLVEIARRLDDTVRDGDLAARIGGDEFAMVLARVQRREDVERLAARVASVFDAPIEWEGRSLLIGGSIGAALSTDAGESVDALFSAADAAMYAAKQDPAARWTAFVPDSERRADERLRDRPELERSIQRREMLVCFQPVVRLDDGGHGGLTVHLQWRHPAKGLMPVADFLPEVEQAGLVAEMTAAGFRNLLGTLAEWIEAGLEPGWTSIVPPPAMLASNSGLRELEALLEEFPEAAERLVIEVPEDTLEGRAEAPILRALGRLRERAVRLSLGGFGRRDGALARLARAGVDEVRISSRIVAGIGRDPEAELLLDAFTAAARNLGIEVLARGVETEEQERHLRRLGCRFATGARYGGARLEPDEARTLLASRGGTGVLQSS